MITFATRFSPWLLRQAERDDPIGALAREAQQDPAWPKRTDALPRLDRSLAGRGTPVATRQARRRASGEWLIATAGEVR